MAKFEYKRVDETKKKDEIDAWLSTLVEEGWKIRNYKEVPAHRQDYIRMQILLEKEIVTKKKGIL
jgi:hypothetical protein